MEVFGIRFVGVNTENGHRLLLTLALIALVLVLRYGLSALSELILHGHRHEQARFWIRQGISITLALLFVLSLLSIWFDDPNRLATVIGLMTAGLAFALQKVITSIAGYFVILRGRTFSVGDRILMGSVRGDVIGLNFTQTTIMEMGQSPGERPDDPNVWVKSRQFTGRIVTVTNDKIFQEPVFNYTRDFPFLWEEMTVPISYKDDRHRAEQILLAAAKRHTVKISEMGQEAIERLERKYYLHPSDLEPKVYYRLTDNWIELTVRFMARTHGTRHIKDAMSREILSALEQAGIGIASATYDIIGLPPIRIEHAAPLELKPRSASGKG